MRRATTELAPRTDRAAHTPEVDMLKITQAAMQDLETVSGRGCAEIVFLDQRNAITLARSAASDPCTVDSAADYDDVEELRCECVEVTAHGSSGSDLRIRLLKLAAKNGQGVLALRFVSRRPTETLA